MLYEINWPSFRQTGWGWSNSLRQTGILFPQPYRFYSLSISVYPGSSLVGLANTPPSSPGMFSFSLSWAQSNSSQNSVSSSMTSCLVASETRMMPVGIGWGYSVESDVSLANQQNSCLVFSWLLSFLNKMNVLYLFKIISCFICLKNDFAELLPNEQPSL